MIPDFPPPQESYLLSDLVSAYFTNFETLKKAEQWDEILAQGSIAAAAARKLGRAKEEAKICAQLTSTSFYQGNYLQALDYAHRCHELSEHFDDPALFLRALYLESAVNRALAGRASESESQQKLYSQAVAICEEASSLYETKQLHNISLKGKIYFNLGAAHADNPQGNLQKAESCYRIALTCFCSNSELDDFIRTGIRLARVHLLQKKFDLAEQLLEEVRPQITNQRISMQADYFEAQLKLALNDFPAAKQAAERGLAKAEQLRAKEDALRLMRLLETIKGNS